MINKCAPSIQPWGTPRPFKDTHWSTVTKLINISALRVLSKFQNTPTMTTLLPKDEGLRVVGRVVFSEYTGLCNCALIGCCPHWSTLQARTLYKPLDKQGWKRKSCFTVQCVHSNKAYQISKLVWEFSFFHIRSTWLKGFLVLKNFCSCFSHISELWWNQQISTQ